MGKKTKLNMWLGIIVLLIFCTNATIADAAEEETFIITRLNSG